MNKMGNIFDPEILEGLVMLSQLCKNIKEKYGNL